MRIAPRHWGVLGLCLLLLTQSALAQGEAPTLTIQKVALSSDPAPGTGDPFGGFFVPIIDSRGTIVFGNETGIWTHRDGVIALHDTVHQSQRRIEKLEHQLTQTVVTPRLHHAIGVFLIVNWDLLCNSA